MFENFYKGFFREFVDKMSNPVSVRDAKSLQYVYCNESFAKLVNKPIEEILGKTASEVIEIENIKKLSYLDTKVIETKSIVKEILKFNIKPDHFEIIEIQKYPHINPTTQEIDFIIDFYQTVTREVTADEILRDTELLHFKIFEYLPLGIVLIRSDDYKIFEVNPYFLKIFELELDQVLYRSIFELPFCKEKERLQKHLALAKELDTAQQFENSYQLPDGRTIDLVLNIAYIHFLHKEPWYLIIVSDVSTIQQANREIISYIQKEQELNILKNRFISLISHELRTPLTGLTLSLDLMQRFGKQLSKAEKERHFEKMRNSVQSIVKLIENALNLEKLTQDNFHVHPKKIYLKRYIEDIIERNLTSFDNKNPVFLQMTEDIEVETDEILFGLILNNLLSNAFKFSPYDRPIYFYVNQADKVYEIKVQNFGEPIPKDEIPKLFTPFYRGRNVGSTKGYGLGLSIVKKAVETLNGSISIESSRENGTIISLTFPITLQTKNQ